MNYLRYFSALVVINLFLLSNCKEDNIAEKIEITMPRFVLENFTLTETHGGKKKWTLYADFANVYDEIISVDTVLVVFFDTTGKEFARLSSITGKLNTRTHNILVRDSVVLFTRDSTTLFTDSLFWQNDSQKILTNSYVRIIKRDSTTIEGNGLKTTPDLTRIEIIGDIKGTSPIQFPNIK
ncbi:MAG: LPS export ABC transporter periplasmic protein LptC [candidate division WOR-3 bacterium]